jgi:hypothetical protein
VQGTKLEDKMGWFVPTTKNMSLVSVKNKYADHQWSLLLVATATTILTISGPWIVQTLRKRLIERSIIIVLSPPPPSTTTTTTTEDEECHAPRNEAELNHQQTDKNNIVLPPPPVVVHHILLTIFPGALIHPSEYIPIAKQVQRRVEVVQQENSPNAEPRIQVTIGIGPLMYLVTPPWTRWAFQNDTAVVAQWIRTKATEAALASSDSSTTTPFFFQDVYVWGHSLGGNAAIEAAYPSHCSGLLLYGGSWNNVLTGQQPQDLIGYPRPTLTMMGERDGFLRYTHVAAELSHRLDDLKRNMQWLAKTTTTAGTFQLERTTRWTKPIVTVPEINHLHMSSGIPPRLTTLSGRTDLTSRYEDDEKSSALYKAQAALAEVAVDFMLANSKPPTPPLRPLSLLPPTTTIKALAQERLLKHCYRTEETLQPFMDMNTLSHKVQFAQQALQSLVLQRLFGPSSPYSRTSPPMVVVEWRERAKDFMYSKPHHCVLHHGQEDVNGRSGGGGMDGSNYQYHLYMEVTEQDPMDIGKLLNPKSRARVAQVSKTLAVKAKSVEGIQVLFTAVTKAGGVTHSTKVDPTTHTTTTTTTTTTHITLQQLNQQTFHHVLNKVVTHEQRQRYLEEGNALTFGPDVDVQSAAPVWLEMPLQLTKQHSRTTTPINTTTSSKNGYIYVLSSPFITTPTTLPSPFDGMYYFKPLSPAQAYEWIVFDAFKNGPGESQKI